MQPSYSFQNNQMSNTNCPGGDYWNSPAPNAGACGTLCNRDHNCAMWSFDDDKRICYLKNQQEYCFPQQDYTSGYRRRSDQPVTTAPAYKVSAPSSDQCLSNCLQNNTCGSWSWDPSNRGSECTLFPVGTIQNRCPTVPAPAPQQHYVVSGVVDRVGQMMPQHFTVAGAVVGATVNAAETVVGVIDRTAHAILPNI